MQIKISKNLEVHFKWGNGVKDLAKQFFSSRAGNVGMWVFLWIFEYNFFSWFVKKLSDDIIRGFIFIGYVLIIYAIYYWITQKRSTEYQIYALVILEFVFNKLNQQRVFTEVFKCPIWLIYIVLIAYFFIRIFLLEEIYYLLHDIYLGFVESNKERTKQKIEEITNMQAALATEKAERIEYIRNRSLIRRQFWSALRDKVIDFVFGIIDFLIAIPVGLFGKNKKINRRTKKSRIVTEQGTENQNEIQENSEQGSVEQAPKWVYVVIAIIAVMAISLFGLLLYYQFYISQNHTSKIADTDILSNFIKNLGNESNSVKVIANIISLCIVDVILLIILMIIAFIVFVVVIQIIKSGNRMVKDLIKSINNPKGTDYSSTVFYSVIVFIICFFVYELYPFSPDDFSELLSNGAFIIYPVMAAVFIPIITAIIDVLNSDRISSYLNSERAERIKEKFTKLALDTLEAMLNYITFVTRDFLMSIQELSIQEFDEPEYKRGENIDNNTKNGNNTDSDHSGDCDNNSSSKGNK